MGEGELKNITQGRTRTGSERGEGCAQTKKHTVSSRNSIVLRLCHRENQSHQTVLRVEGDPVDAAPGPRVLVDALSGLALDGVGLGGRALVERREQKGGRCRSGREECALEHGGGCGGHDW